MSHTYVLGLGNVLMGDDGFGPAVIGAFERAYEVGPDVEVVDLGTPGLDLTPWLADAAHVIIVDTIKADLPPGSVRIYDQDDLTRHAPQPRIGPHDPGLKECVLMLQLAGRAPAAITLVGVVPETCAMGLELSPAVVAAVPAAMAAVVSALASDGIDVRRRPFTTHSALTRQQWGVVTA
jgi:hydrogenase maturation protease